MKPVNQYYTRFKQRLLESTLLIAQNFPKSDGGTNLVLTELSDMRILFSYESVAPVDSEGDYPLDKPRLLIELYESDSTEFADMRIVADFTVVVNREPSGRFHLDNYTTLCRTLLVDEEEVRKWANYGLVLRPGSYVSYEAELGHRIHKELGERLLLRVHQAVFDFSGVLTQ